MSVDTGGLASFEPDPNNPIRVMLIDDHQTVLWGLQQLVNSRTPRMIVVGCAVSVEDATERIGAIDPDVILLDMDLGQRSGLDLLPVLLAHSRARVLILTGMRDQRTLDAAILAGARGIVRKEESAERLLLAIEKVHSGQLWMERDAIARVFQTMQQKDVKKTREAIRCAALTPRERTIVQAIVSESGASNKSIARTLCMSEHTLRNHLTSVYHKLGVDNRLKLYVYAIENGFSVDDGGRPCGGIDG